MYNLSIIGKTLEYSKQVLERDNIPYEIVEIKDRKMTNSDTKLVIRVKKVGERLQIVVADFLFLPKGQNERD